MKKFDNFDDPYNLGAHIVAKRAQVERYEEAKKWAITAQGCAFWEAAIQAECAQGNALLEEEAQQARTRKDRS